MAQQTQPRKRQDSILTKIKSLEQADRKKVIKTQTRRAKIREEYVGHTLGVFNGQGYTNVQITSEMIGRTLGKVAPRVTPTARAKFLSISPRKMRQVGDLVKGLPVEKALDVLNFTPKIAAHHMAKTLKSAVANKLSLEGTAQLDPEHLVVSQIVVGAGPSAKRIQYRSMGRVYRIRKRYCHLDIYLDVDERKQRAAEAKVEGKATKGKAASKAKKASAKPAAKATKAKTTIKKKSAKKKTAKETKTTEKKAAAKKTAAKKSTKASAASGTRKTSGKAADKEKKK